MCDVIANSYKDGEVVWVKVSSRWWPGEVCNEARLPEGLIQTRRKKPLAIVKFFQEDTYEFVRDLNNLMKYDCAKKNDFIKKGMELYRANNKHMLKFPLDVQTAEKLTGGDESIIDDDSESVERKKFNYSDLFGDQTVKKNKKGRKPGPKSTAESTRTTRTTNRRPSASTKSVNATNKIAPAKKVKRSLVLKKKDIKFIPNYKKDVPNHETKIMLQIKPSHDEGELKPYKCRLCDFTSTRQNVIVIHTKSHSNPTPLEIREPTKEILESTKIRGGKSSSKPRSKEMKQRLSKYSQAKYKVDSYIILDTSDNERDYTKPAFTRRRRTSDSSVEVVLEMTTRRRDSDIEEINLAESTDGSSLEKDKKTDEEIRTKLLADWSDEGSECEEEEEEDTNTKAVQPSSAVDKSRKSFTENSNQPAAPEPLRLEDEVAHFILSKVKDGSSIDEKSSSSGPQEGRSSPRKYRNIPKKDRRDVVLKEFNNGDILTARSNSIKEIESTMTTEIDSNPQKPRDERSNSIKEVESTMIIEIDSNSQDPREERDDSAKDVESTVAIESDSNSKKQSDEPIVDEKICEIESSKTENTTVLLEIKTSVETPIDNESETASKTESTSLKPSTSCFDFQEEEEEDFLASIIKLKKKYLSPEKNKDIKEVVDQSKVETEKQDEQLSVDIENLLNSTKLPEIKSTSAMAFPAKPSTSSAEIVSQEVRALPPKERGKRIFKSRNKSRYVETILTITTGNSAIEGISNAVPIASSLKHGNEDTRKSIESNIRSSVDKTPADMTTPVNSAPETSPNSMDKEVSSTTETVRTENTAPDSTTDSLKDIIAETTNFESNEENDINSNENNKEDLNHEEQKSGAPEEVEPVNDVSLAAPEINSKSELEVQSDDPIPESSAISIAQSKAEVELPPVTAVSSNYTDQEDNVVAMSHDENYIDDKNREQEPLETSSLITTKTQSELAVAEALISIPKTLTLNSPIIDLAEPLQSQPIEPPKECEVATISKSNNKPEEEKGPDERQKLSPELDEITLTEVRETESASNTESNSSVTEKDAQHFEKEKVQSGGKLNSVGTRKRRRAHMKITPRKRIVVAPIAEMNDMETKTEDRIIEQFEKDDDDVSILKNTLSLHETLSIKISDKGSESDEVPRPQFSPLSPQGSPSKKHSDDGEDSSQLGDISPLTPPQPRFSPVKQLSEFENLEEQAEIVKPLSSTDELGEQECSRKDAESPKEKTLREQYEESFVQKYIQDAMMFESSEVNLVKEMIVHDTENRTNPTTEVPEAESGSLNAMEIRTEQQNIIEREKTNQSKDAISEIRSFRVFRRKNTRSSSNAHKLPAQIETVVNKKNVIETFSMDVEKNVHNTCGGNGRNPKAAAGTMPDEEFNSEKVPSASDCKDTNLEGENINSQSKIKNNDAGKNSNKMNILVEEIESHMDVDAQQETAEKNIGVQTCLSSFTLKDFRIPKKRKAFNDEINSIMTEKTNNAVVSPTPKEQQPPEKKYKLNAIIATASQKVPSSSAPIALEEDTNKKTVVPPEISSPPVSVNKSGTILNKRSTATPKKLRANSSTKPKAKPLPPLAECVLPKMTHQSSQIITTEGKEIGKDGKGNKFVIIKSGNENKMVRRPETPPPIDQMMHSPTTMIQNIDFMKMSELISKETALQAESVQPFGGGSHIGNTRVVASQTVVSTPKTKTTPPPVRGAGRRRSTKTANYQSGFGQQQAAAEEETNLPGGGNQQELMHSSATSLNKCVVVEKEKATTPATRGRRGGGQTRSTRNTGGRGGGSKIKKEEEIHIGENTQKIVQTNEPQQQQHLQMQILQQQQLQNQQLQQQQQLFHQQQHFQQHQIQQQLQIPQMQQTQVRQQVQVQQHHMQHQMQLQQTQQQQLQLQQQHLQQQFQQQQLQQQNLQLQQQLAKKSTTKLSHPHEKCNSPVTLTASPQIPPSQTEKTVLNVLPIAANSLPPDVEVDESEVASYVAVQAGDMTQPNVYYLCKQQGDEEGLIPVISQPFYLDQHNGTLVLPHQIPIETTEIEAEEKMEMEEQQIVVARTSEEEGLDQQRLIFNIGDNQLIIDYEMAVTLLNNSGGEDLVQLSANDQIFSIHVDTLATAFGLNRITLEKDEEQFLLSNMDIENQLQNAANQDIIAAALAGTEVYHHQQSEIIGDGLVDPNNVSIVEQGITFQTIDPQVSAVKATTNETNAILTQPPIMSTLEIPPNKKKSKLNPAASKINENLDESLAKIGVSTQSSVVPSSLELPITITNPAIAPKTSSNSILLESIYASGLQQSSQMSPPISSAIANDQQELSYEILTSSSVQATQNNLISRGQQIAEFNMVQHSGSVHTTSTYDDPTR